MTVRSRIKKIESRCFTEREQIYESFYKELFSWKADNIGLWITAGLFEFFHGCMMSFPYQDMAEDNMLGFSAFFGMWGVMCYISPYLQYTEQGKSTKLYDKLQYLPISLKELQTYRTKKLAIFCFKMFSIFLVLQLFFAFISYRMITLANILYVVICGFIIPFVISMLAVRFSK